jgi:multidrug efflux pump subunit AcrA (membrane-fusion protein)
MTATLRAKGRWWSNKSLATVFLSFLLIFTISSVSRNGYAQKVPVRVQRAVKKDITSNLSLLGSVNYMSKVNVSSEVDGVLSSVNVEEGDVVNKGQVIAVIDRALLQAQLKQAQATLELAEIDLSKFEYEVKKTEYRLEATKVSMEKLRDHFETRKKLFDIGGATQTEVDEAEMEYQKALADYKSTLEDLRALRVKSNEGRNEVEAKVVKARADVEEIKTNLEKCIIKAPIAGIVSAKEKWSGESTNPNDSVIATIVSTTTVYAEADLNEKDMGLVKTGLQAEIKADAYPDVSFMGKIDVISPTVDTDSRTVKIKISIANDKQLLRPGMFVRVILILDSYKDVVVIPQEAIISVANDKKIVFVIIDEVAFLRQVETGISRDGWVVIRNGVKEGEKVVVEGQERLQDLSSVQVVETGT